jgi:hypothetical protein
MNSTLLKHINNLLKEITWRKDTLDKALFVHPDNFSRRVETEDGYFEQELSENDHILLNTMLPFKWKIVCNGVQTPVKTNHVTLMHMLFYINSIHHDNDKNAVVYYSPFVMEVNDDVCIIKYNVTYDFIFNEKLI